MRGRRGFVLQCIMCYSEGVGGWTTLVVGWVRRRPCGPTTGRRRGSQEGGPHHHGSEGVGGRTLDGVLPIEVTNKHTVTVHAWLHLRKTK